ncbi:hypothetical protein GCM10027347_44750 [Larkinella harenae]
MQTKITSRKQSDVALLNSYLNLKYPSAISIIQADPETLTLDCFAQSYIFLADSHTDQEWYGVFKSMLYDLFAQRQQSPRTALAYAESLAFVAAAQNLLHSIPVAAPMS